MRTFTTVLTLSLLVASSSQSQGCDECCGQAIPLISSVDRILANPLLEGAQSNEVDRETLRDGWCSTDLMATSIFDPYLEFWFNASYLIETVRISGHRTFTHRYATALLVQNDMSQGCAFASSIGTIMDRVYNTSLTSGSDEMNISLEDPLLAANKLRITPYTWTETTGPCMSIELYGCQYNVSSSDDHVSTENDSMKLRTLCVIVPPSVGGATALLILVVVLGVCCCCLIRNGNHVVRGRDKRTASVDGDATIKVVNNVLYHRNKRSSDRRPLAPSNASSLTYDTVPVDLHTTREKREPAVEGDSAKGNEKIVESEGKQVSIPVYEVQYEPVEIKDGQSTADAEKGTSKELQSKLEIKENTMCSHHSYAVIEEDKRDALQEASSNSFPTSHKNEEWKDQEVEQGSIGDISSGRGEKPWRKRIVGSGYENVLSPDSRHALFCESSGPQHFAV